MTHKKIKTIHIHTDYKFVKGTDRFFGDHFENRIFVYNTDKRYTGHYKDDIKFFDWSDVDKVIEATAQADLVVLYDLDAIKSRIALLIPENVTVMWRFFGYELYSKKRDKFLSEKSKQHTGKVEESIPLQVFNFVRHVYGIIKFRGSRDVNFQKAIKRIDYMLVLCREEYDILLEHWPDLPEFIQLCQSFIDDDLKLSENEFNKCKKNTVVIGNNRSSYNNHLDVMEMIDHSKNPTDYTFTLLFNYAGDGEYANAVREAAQGKEHYRLIEEFIPKSEFIEFYNSISALVINGYRQMAFGNIYFALKNGVKIYLNNKNPHLGWLQGEGFRIYSMEDFKSDLSSNNLGLDYDSARYNVQNLKRFAERNSKQTFQSKIREVVQDEG